MAVISKLDLDGKNITKYNNATISNINLNGTGYHFAKSNLVADGKCVDAVEEPIIDMDIYGNSTQILPTEYQQVEYIESTGEQYIDTGYYTKDNTNIDLTIMPIESPEGNTFVFSSRPDSLKPNINCYYNSQKIKFEIGVNLSNCHKSETNGSINNKFNIKLYNKVIYSNGNKVGDYNDQNITRSNNTLLLFSARSRNEIDDRKFMGRFYCCKISEMDILIRDLIPCYRKADNVAGLYDLVNNEFYTNAGTGVFNKGKDIASTINGVGDKTKNLLVITEKFPYLESGINVSRNSDGSIRVQGTPEYGASIFLSRNTNFTLKKGTYTINNTGTKGIDVYLLPTYQKGTITITSDTTYTGCYINIPSSLVGQSFDFSFYPQIEEGRSFTSYEPYGYKIPLEVNDIITDIYLNEPLRKINDYVDILNYKDKKAIRNVSSDNLPLNAPIEEIIDLPLITTNKGTNTFEVQTQIQPSKLSIEYWKQI